MCTRGAARERGTPTVKAAGCPRPSDGDWRTAILIMENEDVLALLRGDKQAFSREDFEWCAYVCMSRG